MDKFLARHAMTLALFGIAFLTACGGDDVPTAAEHTAVACPCCEGHQGSASTVPSKPRGWTTATSEHGRFVVRWRSRPDPIPVNESLEMDVEITRADSGGDGVEPSSDIEVFVHAWMPDHRHGMLRRPVATPVGDGVFRVRGTLLHMRGFWQLFIDVVENGKLDRAQFELDLP